MDTLRIAALIFAVLTLNGCGGSGYYFSKSGVSQQQYDKDNFECKKAAQQPVLTTPIPGMTAGGMSTNKNLYLACFKTKGYTVQSVEERERVLKEQEQRVKVDDRARASSQAQAKAVEAYNLGDYVTALREIKPLAAQGDAPAQFNLGILYHNGHGVPQDYDQARQWYEKAAAQGVAAAQLQLGGLYHTGHGVPKDFVRAYKWYDLSEANGNKDAASFRDALAKQMTPAQIAEALKLAREWKPKGK